MTSGTSLVRGIAKIAAIFTWLVLIPTTVFAQATITGVVRDTSGAVLPGVTVEASSPALIEKVRSVVTDGTGQYRIVDLRPGTYTVTFTLPGFSTVKREGIELTGSFTATVNSELRVGAIDETITVTGEAPIVDTQSTNRQKVFNSDVVDSIPTGRLPTQLGVLIPGVTAAASVGFNGSGAQDVGGAGGDQAVRLTVHGSRANDQRITQGGLNVQMSGAAYSAYTPNLGATEETTIDISGVSAEAAEGGVRINLIPKEGGNTFKGSVFYTFANDSMAGSNFTDDLKARGLQTINSVRKIIDFNPGFGGPIKKDRLWFFGSFKYNVANNWVGGMFADPNWNNPTFWRFEPDTSKPVSNDGLWKVGNVRLTWQASQKHKVAISYTKENQCKCPSFLSATESTGIRNQWGWPHSMATVDWTSPLTNRLLFEAGGFKQYTRWGWFPLEGMNPNLIGFTEQSTLILSKIGWLPNFSDHWVRDLRYRAAMSYITGAHAFKVGFNNGHGSDDTYNYNGPYSGGIPMDYRFNNGIPNQVTIRATPYHIMWNLDQELGIFAQDRWTIDRLTLSGGVRYDLYKNHFPEQRLGPAPLVPSRNITFPRQDNQAWHDVTPRMGASYDLFGNGKTAFKVTLNKYLQGGGSGIGNPVGTIVQVTTRSWNDANRDYVPNCDLTNPATNGECGPMANANFGKPVLGSQFDPKTLRGWGGRPYSWEFSTGLQHEIFPRVSVDVSYFRRWYGNFTVGDDRAVGPGDLDRFSLTAPAHAQLPGGGGYEIGGLYNLKPEKFGVPSDYYVTFANTYGKQIEHWNGVDVSVSARLQPGVLFQAGFSGGRTSTDNCELVEKLPEILFTSNNARSVTSASPQSYCHVDTSFLTQVKGLGSYTIPRVGLQVAGTFQSIPGPELSASYNAPNSAVAPSLGRNLSGGVSNVTVNLVEPGKMYGERLTQLDLRVGKTFRFGQRRAGVNLDIYNALNVDTVLGQSNAFAIWRRPQVILVGRFAKVSLQLDF